MLVKFYTIVSRTRTGLRGQNNQGPWTRLLQPRVTYPNNFGFAHEMSEQLSKSTAADAATAAEFANGSRADKARPLHLCLPAEQSSLARVAEAVEALGEAEAWPPKVRFHVDLVLEELVQNCVSYGYPDGRQGHVEVLIQRQGNTLVIVLEDDGDAFDPFQRAAPDLDLPLEERSIGGLGIHFTRTLMDDYRYRRVKGRNRIELRKSLQPGAGSA